MKATLSSPNTKSGEDPIESALEMQRYPLTDGFLALRLFWLFLLK